jgi:RNA-directed DNA polymerase
MARKFPAVRFERYADDVVVHTRRKNQARTVLREIEQRLASCHLELNQAKTQIVYCKDSNRHGSHEHQRFDFLGYTFRPRSTMNKRGEMFVSFAPAISDEAAKKIRRTIRSWRIQLWGGTPFEDIARQLNPIVRGWINYYGRFRPSN